MKIDIDNHILSFLNYPATTFSMSRAIKGIVTDICYVQVVDILRIISGRLMICYNAQVLLFIVMVY